MLAIFFIASSFTKHSDRDLRAKQVNLIIRQIGHRLLLQAGDSTSRVLPVTESKEGTFLLSSKMNSFLTTTRSWCCHRACFPKHSSLPVTPLQYMIA
jgi:hypothetical protein